MRVLRILVALALVAVIAAGCNTVRGVGKDIEKGGQKLQDAGDR